MAAGGKDLAQKKWLCYCWGDGCSWFVRTRRSWFLFPHTVHRVQRDVPLSCWSKSVSHTSESVPIPFRPIRLRHRQVFPSFFVSPAVRSIAIELVYRVARRAYRTFWSTHRRPRCRRPVRGVLPLHTLDNTPVFKYRIPIGLASNRCVYFCKGDTVYITPSQASSSDDFHLKFSFPFSSSSSDTPFILFHFIFDSIVVASVFSFFLAIFYVSSPWVRQYCDNHEWIIRESANLRQSINPSNWSHRRGRNIHRNLQ